MRGIRTGVGVVGLAEAALATGVAVLVLGFLYAAASDLRNREAPDRLWQLLGIVGFVVGAVAISPGGAVPLALWAAVGVLTLEHMFSWDERLGERGAVYADLIELGAYLAVGLVVGLAAVRWGVGASAVPYAVVAVFATVVFARVLFEVGILYGGADAKALMIAGLLVPTFPSPLLLGGGGALSVPSILPFAIDLLMNAALLSVIVPIAVAVRNVRHGEFEMPQGFAGYSIPVRELPKRFVWVRDPAYPSAREEEAEVETSREDQALRVKIAGALTARGVNRVWVTPQIPFLVLMAAGAITALLAGNLVVDLIALI